MKKFPALLCASLFLVSSMQAAVYKIDFETAGGSAGSSWNVYAAPGDVTGTLKDTSQSTAAGITISASGDINNSAGNNLYGDNGPAWIETDAGTDNAADDFFWTNNDDAVDTSFTISFAGLTPGDTVSIDLFASRQSSLNLTAYYEYSLDSGSSWEGFSVLENTGVAASTNGWDTNNTQTQPFNLDETGGFTLGRYMNASSLTVGASGTLDVVLTVPVTLENADYAGINAMQLTVIPEPSSVVMVVLGFMGLGMFRHRKNRR
ncbi:PEP-CTERM sorting domain-containing protein [Kiritimatiellaeota bacterium B1221]|nr:PEP-CTERM sorting domain-containing protein [Kiritimatiellaeota bacterium B1221]